MNCQKVRENLWEYQHNELGSDLARQIAEHLSSCSVCDVQFQHFKQVEAELDCLDELEPSPYFDQKLDISLDEVAKRHAALRSRLFFWFHGRYAVSFVLLLLTTVGVWVGFRHQQAQKLNSMEDVLKVQERYLGGAGTSAVRNPANPSLTTVQSVPNGEAGTGASSTEEEAIPEADLAVLENYELLQDYDFLKKFDLADLQTKSRQTTNPN